MTSVLDRLVFAALGGVMFVCLAAPPLDDDPEAAAKPNPHVLRIVSWSEAAGAVIRDETTGELHVFTAEQVNAARD